MAAALINDFPVLFSHLYARFASMYSLDQVLPKKVVHERFCHEEDECVGISNWEQMEFFMAFNLKQEFPDEIDMKTRNIIESHGERYLTQMEIKRYCKTN